MNKDKLDRRMSLIFDGEALKKKTYLSESHVLLIQFPNKNAHGTTESLLLFPPNGRRTQF